MKRQIAVVLALGLAGATLNANPIWVTGVVAGISTAVSISIHLNTYLQDYEDSKIDVGIDNYTYENTVEYPMISTTYNSRWRVYTSISGNYRWRKTVKQNGTVIEDSTEEFELGTSGLPLMKRVWNCSVHTATAWYSAHSESSLYFYLKHTVTHYPTYVTNLPSSYEGILYIFGDLWPGICGPAPITYMGMQQSKGVQRNNRTTMECETANLEIDQFWGRSNP
jgi:hypothetical protein